MISYESTVYFTRRLVLLETVSMVTKFEMFLLLVLQEIYTVNVTGSGNLWRKTLRWKTLRWRRTKTTGVKNMTIRCQMR